MTHRTPEEQMDKFSLNCIELQDYQPNRYPFLMDTRTSP